MVRKKSARDTVVPGDESPFKATVVSSADDANIINNLEERIEKSKNISQRGKKNFLTDLATDLEAERDSSGSEYATFVTNNGITVTIRLSNHNTTVSQFDYRSEKEGISIVISRKDNKGITNDGVAHVVEFFYSDKKLKKAEGDPYAQIARAIQQVLYSGEYKDTTGLSKPQEVNPPQYFRTSSGEAGIRGTGKLIRFSQGIRGTG